MPTRYGLERTQVVCRPRDEVFAFFSNAHNLESITPDFLRFRVLSATGIRVEEGTIIDYRLSLFKIPFFWRTRIEVYSPPERFVDVQLRGPYSLWHHTHTFAQVEGGTLIRDEVLYEMPFGPLGRLAHALFVRRSLARIFDHRERRIALLFSPSRPATPPGAP